MATNLEMVKMVPSHPGILNIPIIETIIVADERMSPYLAARDHLVLLSIVVVIYMNGKDSILFVYV